MIIYCQDIIWPIVRNGSYLLFKRNLGPDVCNPPLSGHRGLFRGVSFNARSFFTIFRWYFSMSHGENDSCMMWRKPDSRRRLGSYQKRGLLYSAAGIIRQLESDTPCDRNLLRSRVSRWLVNEAVSQGKTLETAEGQFLCLLKIGENSMSALSRWWKIVSHHHRVFLLLLLPRRSGLSPPAVTIPWACWTWGWHSWARPAFDAPDWSNRLFQVIVNTSMKKGI